MWSSHVLQVITHTDVLVDAHSYSVYQAYHKYSVYNMYMYKHMQLLNVTPVS